MKCYHLVTPQEMTQIIGDKLDKELVVQASERFTKLFDAEGNIKKKKKKINVCCLCDSSGIIKGNHDFHNFCKRCWKGATSHYKKEIGCLVRDCPYFSKDLNNVEVKKWIKEN